MSKPLRVGVNLWALRLDGGGARYAFTSLMAELVPLDAAFSFVLFVHPLGRSIVDELVAAIARSDAAAASRVRVVEVETTDEIIAHQDSFDLLFGPLNNHEPRLYDRPSVAILHDAQEQEYPQYFAKEDLAARRELYPEICRAATVLVAISAFCRDSFVRHFAIDPAGVEVIHNAAQGGVDEPAPADAAWASTDEADGPAPVSPYFLFPANTYPHKNHRVLLDVAERAAAAGDPVDLVFVGSEINGGFPLRAEIERRRLGDRCRVMGGVSPARLRWLYSRAAAAVIPSEYEGFCLPVVEAMRCGCPVVCSDIPALREIAGEDAVFVPACDAGALLDAMTSVRDDRALRERLVQGGLRRGASFSWRRSAEQMRDAFVRASGRFYSDHPVRLDVLLHAAGPAPALEKTLASLAALPEADRKAIHLHLDGIRPEAWETTAQQCSELGLRAGCLKPAMGAAACPLARLESIAAAARVDAGEVGLVMEVLAGNVFRPTALASVRWAASAAPGVAVILGEVLEADGPRGAIAFPRTIHDGVWTVRGALYQEMVLYRAGSLPALAARVGDHDRRSPDGWRWSLVAAARRRGEGTAGGVFTSRRLLADVRPGAVGPNGEHGRTRFYDASGRPRQAMAHRVEPMLKRVKPLVPGALWERGRSLWFSKVVG
ncbi:MAG: glycosyltransferase family 4 protein [Phycisphaeraceae bacterium]|nr:MAG: glycosyltransferase family 4 protein [Phycisphaeraceae bacterium]